MKAIRIPTIRFRKRHYLDHSIGSDAVHRQCEKFTTGLFWRTVRGERQAYERLLDYLLERGPFETKLRGTLFHWTNQKDREDLRRDVRSNLAHYAMLHLSALLPWLNDPAQRELLHFVNPEEIIDPVVSRALRQGLDVSDIVLLSNRVHAVDAQAAGVFVATVLSEDAPWGFGDIFCGATLEAEFTMLRQLKKVCPKSQLQKALQLIARNKRLSDRARDWAASNGAFGVQLPLFA